MAFGFSIKIFSLRLAFHGYALFSNPYIYIYPFPALAPTIFCGMSEQAEPTPQSPSQSDETQAPSPKPATAETTKGKKRQATDSPARKTEDDHRKRRRNRTTQSCVNCHTSKRMCDRKRPCGRCTQLGLTGLCVYEVDDPNQRHDEQDEKSRLQKRVAELEGVIRELKNKPHPRWAHPGDGPERWHSRARLADSCDKDGASTDDQANTPSSFGAFEPWSDDQEPYLLGEDGNVLLQAPPGSNSSRTQALSQYTDLYGAHGANDSPGSCPSSIDTPSTFNAQSPAVTTPGEESFQPQITIALAGDQQQSDGQYTAPLPGTYLPSAGMDEGLFGELLESMLRPDIYKESRACDQCSHPPQGSHRAGGHCGCMTEPVSYSVALELTLRLRKAANLLGRSGRHTSSSDCLLYRLVTELDAYVATTLGNMSPPLADACSATAFRQSRMEASNTLAAIQQHHSIHGAIATNPSLTSASSPPSFLTVPSWDEPFTLWAPPQ
ncbi:hypothetical protein OE88DRAFT_1194961 [Heliocybe sulcata]|uniref:Zn(2)-C6 fungal-type domain-containing protein n=1 Tax=Heliocybe sulcata TaxID=5364 RepID=A0A5C3NAR1_9AGAM|nr:hypothetical protein OE88DRAFT_1194961 [Heliocybe sulcata]